MCKIKNLLPALLLLFFVNSTYAKADVNQDLISKISFGRSADVDYLLKQKADPNAVNSAGVSVLMLAAARVDEEAPKMVQLLINAGADIYKPDANGDLPIIEAIKHGHPNTVKVLIDNKSLMSVKDKNGNDLIKLAEQRNNIEILNAVRAGVAAEKGKLIELKSDDNLNKLIKKYSLLSCSEYYLSYYKRENPDLIGDEKYASIMAQNKSDLEEAKTQLSSLFDLRPSDIAYISTQSKQQTENKLGSLLTKENRLYNGFGTHTHLNLTCKTIADQWDSRRVAQKK